MLSTKYYYNTYFRSRYLLKIILDLQLRNNIKSRLLDASLKNKYVEKLS